MSARTEVVTSPTGPNAYSAAEASLLARIIEHVLLTGGNVVVDRDPSGDEWIVSVMLGTDEDEVEGHAVAVEPSRHAALIEVARKLGVPHEGAWTDADRAQAVQCATMAADGRHFRELGTSAAARTAAEETRHNIDEAVSLLIGAGLVVPVPSAQWPDGIPLDPPYDRTREV